MHKLLQHSTWQNMWQILIGKKKCKFPLAIYILQALSSLLALLPCTLDSLATCQKAMTFESEPNNNIFHNKNNDER